MNAMHCPTCGLGTSSVVETRESGPNTRRRRRCQDDACGRQWTTDERVAVDDPLDAPGPPTGPEWAGVAWGALKARRLALGPYWSMLRLAALAGSTETRISWMERPDRGYRRYWPPIRDWVAYHRALTDLEARR
jgi:hypothetical protein